MTLIPSHLNAKCGSARGKLNYSLWVRASHCVFDVRADSSDADSIGQRGARAPPPHFYKWLGTEGIVSRKTANKKLIKLYWPSQKRSPKLLIVVLEPKKWRGTTKFFSGTLPRIGALPNFQIRSGATGWLSPPRWLHRFSVSSYYRLERRVFVNSDRVLHAKHKRQIDGIDQLMKWMWSHG